MMLVLVGLGAMLAFWICRALAYALIHSILAPLVGRERLLRFFGSPAPHNAAAQDLKHWLAEGPLPAREIKTRAVRSGHGLAALSRAATDLGVFEYTDANDEIWWDAHQEPFADGMRHMIRMSWPDQWRELAACRGAQV